MELVAYMIVNDAMDQSRRQATLKSIVSRLLQAPTVGESAGLQARSPERLLVQPLHSESPSEATAPCTHALEVQVTKRSMFHPSYEMALLSGWRPRSAD